MKFQRLLGRMKSNQQVSGKKLGERRLAKRARKASKKVSKTIKYHRGPLEKIWWKEKHAAKPLNCLGEMKVTS